MVSTLERILILKTQLTQPVTNSNFLVIKGLQNIAVLLCRLYQMAKSQCLKMADKWPKTYLKLAVFNLTLGLLYL